MLSLSLNRGVFFLRNYEISDCLFANKALIKKGTKVYNLSPCFYGAADPIRTDDLLITSELLYQLSYSGKHKQGSDT